MLGSDALAVRKITKYCILIAWMFYLTEETVKTNFLQMKLNSPPFYSGETNGLALDENKITLFGLTRFDYFRIKLQMGERKIVKLHELEKKGLPFCLRYLTTLACRTKCRQFVTTPLK